MSGLEMEGRLLTLSTPTCIDPMDVPKLPFNRCVVDIEMVEFTDPELPCWSA